MLLTPLQLKTRIKQNKRVKPKEEVSKFTYEVRSYRGGQLLGSFKKEPRESEIIQVYRAYLDSNVDEGYVWVHKLKDGEGFITSLFSIYYDNALAKYKASFLGYE